MTSKKPSRVRILMMPYQEDEDGDPVAYSGPVTVLTGLPRTTRRHELRLIVPLADSTIYETEKRGEFPRRFNLTPRCVGWDLEEVEVWLGMYGRAGGGRAWPERPSAENPVGESAGGGHLVEAARSYPAVLKRNGFWQWSLVGSVTQLAPSVAVNIAPNRPLRIDASARSQSRQLHSVLHSRRGVAP